MRRGQSKAPARIGHAAYFARIIRGSFRMQLGLAAPKRRRVTLTKRSDRLRCVVPLRCNAQATSAVPVGHLRVDAGSLDPRHAPSAARSLRVAGVRLPNWRQLRVARSRAAKMYM